MALFGISYNKSLGINTFKKPFLFTTSAAVRREIAQAGALVMFTDKLLATRFPRGALYFELRAFAQTSVYCRTQHNALVPSSLTSRGSLGVVICVLGN